MASFFRFRREKDSIRAVLVVMDGMPLASSICRISVLSKPGPPTMLPVVQAKTRRSKGNPRYIPAYSRTWSDIRDSPSSVTRPYGSAAVASAMPWGRCRWKSISVEGVTPGRIRPMRPMSPYI